MTHSGLHPQVSILLCVYNAWPFIAEAVNSALASEGVSFELVIVDDGSTDEGGEWLRAQTDKRIVLVEGETNRGIAEAANHGLSHCSAPFIARFDADDLMHPLRLQKQVAFLEANPNIDVVGSRVELMSASFPQEGLLRFVNHTNTLLTHEQMKAYRFRDTPIINPSATVRREVYENHGDYLKDVPEDYEFWMRLFEGGCQFHKLDEVLIHWRDLENRLTRSHADYTEERFRKVKVDYFTREWRRVNAGRPLWIWGKNREASYWHSALQQEGISVSGFVDFKEGSWKELPVLNLEDALKLKDVFFLVSVRDVQGSVQIQNALNQKGSREGLNYYMV